MTEGSNGSIGQPPVGAKASRRPLIIATLLRPEGPTGVQTHIREVMAYFTSLGTPPRVVTPLSWGGPLSVPVFSPRLVIERLNGGAGVAWYRYWHYHFLRRALTSGLRAVGDAVVYAQCPLSARAALEARRSPAQRVVAAVHFNGSQADEWVDARKIRRNGPVYKAIVRTEQQLFPKVDGIIFVSRSAQRELLERVRGLDAVPQAVIPNFVGSGHSVAVPDHPDRPSADLVSVGNLLRIKNHRFLLEVLAACRARGKIYSLDVIGEGPLAGRLAALARKLDLEGQVRFLGHRDDVRLLLPHYRAYVHASTRESFSIAIIEAMAAGLPVVTAPTTGASELLVPGREGLFWSLDDVSGAAQLLIDLLEDEPRRRSMAKAAERRFAATYQPAVVGPALERFLMQGGAPTEEAHATSEPMAGAFESQPEGFGP